MIHFLSPDALPEDGRALVFLVVDGPANEIDMPSRPNVDIVWLHRRDAAAPDQLLVDAVARASFPDGTYDVFVHGEAGETRAVRKHLIADRGFDATGASISPYWRRTFTDEDWRQVKRQWIAEQALDA